MRTTIFVGPAMIAGAIYDVARKNILDVNGALYVGLMLFLIWDIISGGK